MAKSIANPTPSQVSGRLATWHRVMEEAGLTYDDLQAPIDDHDFRKRLVRIWQSGVQEVGVSTLLAREIGSGVSEPIIKIYPVDVDYSLGWDGAAVATEFDDADQRFSEVEWMVRDRFSTPREGKVKVPIHTIYFKRWMSPIGAIEAMESLGLQPLVKVEMRDFARRHPYLQHHLQIYSLGSVWGNPGGRCYVAYISGSMARRNLGLYQLEARGPGGYELSEYWQFAARPLYKEV